MKFTKLFMMLFMFTCYVDGGEGGGAGDGAGDGGNAGDGDAGAGDGNTGDGDKLLAGKYVTQEELETGYLELQSTFSSKDELHKADLAKFTAPDAYAPKEGWKDDNAMDNRMMSVLQDVGREVGLSQESYELMFDGIKEMQTRVAESDLADTIKSIPNFENRAQSVQDVAMKFLRKDQADAMDKLMTSKESFEAVEVLMSALRGGALPSNPPANPQENEADIRDQIAKLNPADSAERKRLMGVLNARGEGQGRLV